MEILKVIGNILLTGVILLAFFAAWSATVYGVYKSALRRRLPFGERVFWTALAVVLPFMGALIYLLARVSGIIVTPPPPVEERRDSTEIMEGSLFSGYANPVPGSNPPPRWQPPPVTGPGARAFSARCQLEVVEGPCAGNIFTIDHLPALIGRGEEAAVRLDDDHRISRRQAEIFDQQGDIYIRDLGSMHGTRLNGTPLGEKRLSGGDTIIAGDSVILFKK
jgi:hypothetical protein